VWEVRVYVGRDPATGRPIQKSTTVHGGERAAKDAIVRLRDQVARRQLLADQTTVGGFIDLHLEHLAKRGRSPKTLATYRSRGKTIRAHFGTMKLADVTPKTIDHFYDTLLAGDAKPGTVLQYHLQLSGMFRQAVKWDVVPVSPVERATAPSYPRKAPVAPTVEQVKRLLSEAETRNPTIAALLLVAVTTGARRGELCALRVSDVDWAQRIVTISRSAARVTGRTIIKGTKTDEPRRIAMDDLTGRVLAARVARFDETVDGISHAADPFLFSHDPRGETPLNPDVVTSFFGRLREDLGMPKVNLHHLRRFMVSQGLAAGVDVRTVAGRAGHDPAVAMKDYSQFMEVKDRVLADHLGALLAGDAGP
jgi:integrase